MTSAQFSIDKLNGSQMDCVLSFGNQYVFKFTFQGLESAQQLEMPLSSDCKLSEWITNSLRQNCQLDIQNQVILTQGGNF